MIKATHYYWVECDACGAKADEGSDYTAWGDTGAAVDSAVNADWVTVESEAGDVQICTGHQLNPEICPNCEEDLDESDTALVDGNVVQQCPHCKRTTIIPLDHMKES